MEVPRHGSGGPGVEDADGCFLGVVGGQAVIVVAARGNVTVVFDTEQVEGQAWGVDCREITDRAVAGSLMEPLRLVMLTVRLCTVEATGAREGGEWEFLTEDSHAR